MRHVRALLMRFASLFGVTKGDGELDREIESHVQMLTDDNLQAGMVKDSRRFAENEGWGFASFKGGERTGGDLSPERQRKCFDCHAKRRDRDYVQSSFRE